MSFYGGFKTFSVWVAVHFVRFFGSNPYYDSREMHTPRGWLQLLDVAGNFLAFGFFSKIAWSQWQHVACPWNVLFKERVACFLPAVLPCVTVIVIGIVFFLSRRSAKKELFQSKELFPSGRLPGQWIIPTAPAKIAVSVTLFFLSYMVIAWYIDRIAVVSALMLGIACIDFNTLRWIRKHVTGYFRNSEYAPVKGERDCELIQKRREIIQEYFYTNPQYWKETGRVAGCAIALLVALRGHHTSAYVVLLSTLVGNEIVTAKWRAHRDREWLSLQGGGPLPSAMAKASAP